MTSHLAPVVEAGNAPVSDLQALLTRQRNAFELCDGVVPVAERKQTLSRLLDCIVEHRLALAHAMRDDFGGRAVEESLLELFVVIDDLRHAKRNVARWAKRRRVGANWQFRPSRAELRPQPLGVVGVIGAYNYPVMTTLSPVVNALAAGNHVMMKPSDMTPKTTALLGKLIGGLFDDSQVAVVDGGVDVSRAFSTLPFDHLVFTGSTRVGREVMKAAADKLVPVTLELGGKSPVLIGEDFDIEEAARHVVQSKLLNAGQTCIAGDYALVPAKARDAFVAHAIDAIRTSYASLVDNTDYGRLLSPSDWTRLQDWTEEARSNGASVEMINPADEVCTADNRVFPPTVVWDCPADTKLRNEEVFGPVLPVLTYETLDDAIGQINAGPRPLALYVFSKRSSVVDAVLSRTIAGGVSVNGCGYHAIQHKLPFGGVGSSGIGCYRGQAGFDRLSHLKPVLHMSALTKAGALLRPPYGKVAAWVLGFMLHNRPRREETGN